MNNKHSHHKMRIEVTQRPRSGSDGSTNPLVQGKPLNLLSLQKHESASAETHQIQRNPLRVKGWEVENQAWSGKKCRNEMDKGVFRGERLIS